jgi:hypothetical protein
MQQQLKAMFGDDFNGFYWPTALFDNFGVGTSYNGSNGANPLALKPNFICTLPNALDKPDPTVQADIISMYGYTDSGRGSAITLNQNEQNSAALSALLPQMFKALDLNLNSDWSNGVQSSVSFNDAYERVLIPDKFDALVMNQTNYPSLKKTYLSGNLVTAVSDLFIDGLSVTIQASNGFNGNLTASLSNVISTSEAGNSPTVRVSVHLNSDGSYTLSNTQPVIVAILYKQLPAPSGFGTSLFMATNGYKEYWNDGKFKTVKRVVSANSDK